MSQGADQDMTGGSVPWDMTRKCIFWVFLFQVFIFLDFASPCFAGEKSRQLPRSAQGPLQDLIQDGQDAMTGRMIMAEVFQRHKAFPYVYEEQTMVLTDSAGHRDVRKLRRFSRLEKDGTARYLLVFDYPAEVRGVALRVILHPGGEVENQIYLPALGKELASGRAKDQSRYFLGTDFALEDLLESLENYQYVRKPDESIAKISYFVVEAYPLDGAGYGSTGYSMRRLFIRQDNFFIVRIDYYDRGFRFQKQLTLHDLKKVGKKMWRANMLLMENKRYGHTTLIKIDQRVFSQDYVRRKFFTPSWLRENQHMTGMPEAETIQSDQTESSRGLSGENPGTGIDNSP